MDEPDDALGSLLHEPSTERKKVLSFLFLIGVLLLCAGAISLSLDASKHIDLSSLAKPAPLPPFPSQQPATDGVVLSQATNSARVSINAATAAQLQELPGIGPIRAQQIIQGRPYRTLEELPLKGKVSKAVYEAILAYISL